MEKLAGNVLIVDDDADVLQAARLVLKRHVARVEVEQNPQALPFLLGQHRYDVILLDMNYTRDIGSGREGFHWLARIRELDPDAVVILITAYGDVEMAVRAIKEGATDFVLKPWQNEKLLATVLAALQLRQSRRENDALRAREQQLQTDLNQPFREMLGQSSAMQQVFETIRRVAPTDANVLILGENGTGKEVVARALHQQSARAQAPFVGVDLGAIATGLFESELFGHVKGAFTDAREDRPGRFELATGGTLFLDEIGNLSLPLQAKLLSALQNRTVTRVGSAKARPVDIRLLCATNLPLYEMVAEQTFRQDLLYRINTIEIRLPPLRERQGDVALLADFYLRRYAQKYRKAVRRISPAAQQKLAQYAWPGNVRELQHTLERAVIMCDEATLQPDDLLFSTAPGARPPGGVSLEDYNLEEVEKLLIRKVLDKHQGNISQAARELGLTRASLYRRLEKYGF